MTADLLRQAATALQRGDLPGAERLYLAVLATAPANAAALHMLGIVRAQQGRLEEAGALIARAVTADPRAADARVNLGNVLTLMGRCAEAVESYDAALALAPRDAGTLNNRGNALLGLGRTAEALDSFDRALMLAPRQNEALYNRANALLTLGRRGEAVTAYESLLALDPRHAGAWNNRGIALWDLGKREEALASYGRALQAQPGFLQALNNRAEALTRLRRFDAALADTEAALKLAPDRADLLASRAGLLLRRKHYGAALAAYRELRARDPADRYALGGMLTASINLCDWRGTAAILKDAGPALRQGDAVIPPFMFLGLSGDPALQLLCARRAAADRAADIAPLPPAAFRHDRLRIGYLSSDFCQHPVPALIVALLEAHDRSRFEVHGLSTGLDDGSALRRRIERAFETFHDVQAESAEAVAALIRRLEIDILVDLNGHTEGDNFEILARRPAPLQVNYLGYPGTTGAASLDYILTDPLVAPLAEQAFFSERIVELPRCYFPTSYAPVAPPPSRAAEGLPEAGFVFASFNNSWKITEGYFSVWLRLLKQVEGSVLWLLAANADFQARLADAARAAGIDPARLVFAPRATAEAHLARQQLADLMLDTGPYCGHMTSADALWAGVPLVTTPGTAFAGRVSASLLTTLGVAELIAPYLAAYEALALALARDPARLKALRAKLARQRTASSLFDRTRLARAVESAFTQMWAIHSAGEAPRGFRVT